MASRTKVVVTGALGQIAYSLLFRLLAGDLLGKDTKIDLALLDIEPLQGAFPGLVMEIEDVASPVLGSLNWGHDPNILFRDADIVFMLGAKPRSSGMERKDLLGDNGVIFQRQGRALNEHASRSVKALVVGNPCHTNCLIALKNAPDLSPLCFSAMSSLDEMRAKAALSKKIGRPSHAIGPVAIWGNHSSTLVPDAFEAKIMPSEERVKDSVDHVWLEGEFIQIVQQRGAEVIKARGKSSAASAAHAALYAMKSWVGHGVPVASFGRYSANNPYGIDEDLVFSFPCRPSDGALEYATEEFPGISPWLMKHVRTTEKELQEERELVRHLYHT